MSGYDIRPIRRSLRLKHYNYAQAGAYFVTVCVQGRSCLFGDIRDADMRLNEAGRMIESAWAELESRFPDVNLDASIVMPNHVHGIIVLAEPSTTSPLGAGLVPARVKSVGAGLMPARVKSPVGAGLVPARTTLAIVMGAFKSITTVLYARGVKHSRWPAFHGRIWQRSYYEHVIRDEAALQGIREYIANNPLQWDLDRENPSNAGKSPARAGAVPARDNSIEGHATTRVAPAPWDGV